MEDSEQGQALNQDKEQTKKSGANIKTAALLFFFAVSMIGVSYAAVPLYKLFCQVTGFGGATVRADKAPSIILDKVIRVRFDANSSNKKGWLFKPKTRFVDVKIGQTVLVEYWAKNTSDQDLKGTANFNVAPEQAGGFFNKIECFCFKEQILKAGEEIDMPVTFFIDPEIIKDSSAKRISEITLSYTFYVSPMREEKKIN